MRNAWARGARHKYFGEYTGGGRTSKCCHLTANVDMKSYEKLNVRKILMESVKFINILARILPTGTQSQSGGLIDRKTGCTTETLK